MVLLRGLRRSRRLLGVRPRLRARAPTARPPVVPCRPPRPRRAMATLAGLRVALPLGGGADDHPDQPLAPQGALDDTTPTFRTMDNPGRDLHAWARAWRPRPNGAHGRPAPPADRPLGPGPRLRRVAGSSTPLRRRRELVGSTWTCASRAPASSRRWRSARSPTARPARAARRPHRQARRRPGGRPGQRAQPGRDHRPVPPGDRRRRQPHRLRRRPPRKQLLPQLERERSDPPGARRLTRARRRAVRRPGSDDAAVEAAQSDREGERSRRSRRGPARRFPPVTGIRWRPVAAAASGQDPDAGTVVVLAAVDRGTLAHWRRAPGSWLGIAWTAGSVGFGSDAHWSTATSSSSAASGSDAGS